MYNDTWDAMSWSVTKNREFDPHFFIFGSASATSLLAYLIADDGKEWERVALDWVPLASSYYNTIVQLHVIYNFPICGA